MITVSCPCGTRMQLAEQWAGKQGKCPRCGALLDIPRAAPAVAHPQEPPAPAQPVSKQPLPQAPSPQAPPTEVDDPFTPPTTQAKAVEPARTQPPLPQQPPPAAASQPNRLDSPSSGSPILSRRVLLGGKSIPLYAVVAGGGSLAALLILLLAVASTQWDESDPVAHAPPGSETETESPREPIGTAANRSSREPVVDPSIAPGSSPEPAEPAASASEQPITRSEPPSINPPSPSPAGSPTTIAADPTPATPLDSGPRSVGLTGLSQQYDDRQCQMIQHQYGIRVPAAADMIEIDGERLMVSSIRGVQESPAPYLLLPRGTHAVRWRSGEQAVPITIAEEHHAIYTDMRAFFAIEGQLKTSELRSRSARAMDVHGAPYLLNFIGSGYAAEEKWEAAERTFRRSIHVNPLFSPAHLNLAYCLHRKSDSAPALRELKLADEFNVGNVYGLRQAIDTLRKQVEEPQPASQQAVPFVAEVYVSSEVRSQEDNRLEALMQAMSKYAVRPSEQGKALNNLAIHYSSSGRTELALEHFRQALGAVRVAGPERFAVARQIFANMQAACQSAGFPEAAEYAYMQQAVRP